ncbi:MAG: alpha/beta hydrolase [Rhizobiaceae bacterium]
MAFPDKYRSLIDAQTWAFIERTAQWYPPDAVNFSIEKQRQVYDDLCNALSVDYPEGVKSSDFSIAAAASDHTIPCRKYECNEPSASAQILYFHGGGFVIGGLHSHDSYCAEICHATRLPLTAVDYRLAPEHPFPADYEDVVQAYRHLVGESELPIILMGDSAGGNLAAAVTHASRAESRQPIGQLLVYPTLGNDFDKGSYLEHANAPMLTTEDIMFYARMRTAGDLSKWQQKELSPLLDPDFSNLPPTVIFAAQCDPLRDDGEAYCAKIRAAGGKAKFIEEAGLVHSYLLARHSVDRAKLAFDNISQALSLLSRQTW